MFQRCMDQSPLQRVKYGEMPTEVIAGTKDPFQRPSLIEFSIPKPIGSGTFGTVYVARMAMTGEHIALKKVLKDPQFTSRELSLLRTLDHPNIISLKYHFTTINELSEEHLYLITEYMPKTLYQEISGYRRTHRNVPIFHVKIISFQIARALHYLHRQGICHRDLKTQNVLYDPDTYRVKLCDFGSAKKLSANEPNLSYICSRPYRAPELFLGYNLYTTAIDIWSFGIVLIELITGNTPFNGTSEDAQLQAIAQVLGSPPSKLVTGSNMKIEDFPQRAPRRLRDFLPVNVPSLALKLLKSILTYDWAQRPHAIEICAHEFFDDLRLDKSSVIRSLPDIFRWQKADIEARPDLKHKIFPKFILNPRRSSSHS